MDRVGARGDGLGTYIHTCVRLMRIEGTRQGKGREGKKRKDEMR